MIPSNLRNFFESYHIKILNQKLTSIRGKNQFFTDLHDANIVINSETNNTERIYVVEIPETSLNLLNSIDQKAFDIRNNGETRLSKLILEKEWNEHALRNQYPSVKVAWENYSLMLHMVKNNQELE